MQGSIFPPCLLYTSDAADERSSVDLGGRRIIKKKKMDDSVGRMTSTDHKISDHDHKKQISLTYAKGHK